MINPTLYVLLLAAAGPKGGDARPAFLDPEAESFTSAALTALQDEEAADGAADEAAEEEEPPPRWLGFDWSGGATVGITVNRGNTRSHTATVSVDVEGNGENDRFTAGALYIGGRNENRDRNDPNFREVTTTARSVTGRLQYDYFLTQERDVYVYGNGLAQRDGIRDLDLLWQVGTGVGYQWWTDEDHAFLWCGDRKQSLNTEIGLTYTEEDFEDPPPPTPSSDAEYLGARAAVNYAVTLSEASSAYAEVEWLPSLEDFYDNQLYRSRAGLRSAISGNLNAEFGVLFNYDTSPAPGFGRRDITYIFGLNWSF